MIVQKSGSNETSAYLTASEGSITPASVIAVGAVMSGLPSVAVALRFYAKSRRASELTPDDWLILISLVRVLLCSLRTGHETNSGSETSN